MCCCITVFLSLLNSNSLPSSVALLLASFNEVFVLRFVIAYVACDNFEPSMDSTNIWLQGTHYTVSTSPIAPRQYLQETHTHLPVVLDSTVLYTNQFRHTRDVWVWKHLVKSGLYISNISTTFSTTYLTTQSAWSPCELSNNCLPVACPPPRAEHGAQSLLQNRKFYLWKICSTHYPIFSLITTWVLMNCN